MIMLMTRVYMFYHVWVQLPVFYHKLNIVLWALLSNVQNFWKIYYFSEVHHE